MNLLTIPHKLDTAAATCRAIVETPRGHRNKFSYDPDTGLFRLGGVLPAGMAFPLSFGFVPGTLAQDGDPIDIMILADEELPVGVLLTAKLLGVIEADQTERDGSVVRNDRLIAKVAGSHLYGDLNDLDCLGKAFVGEIERFFVTYNELKRKRFEVVGIGGPARACALIEAAAL